MTMTRRGFTLIEILLVIAIIGAVAALTYPRIAEGLNRENVRSARQTITSLHARARATAIQRGRNTSVVHSGNQVYILSRHPVTGAIDTISTPVNIYDSYGGVTQTWSRDTLVFDPRGVGMETSATMVEVRKGTLADTIRITPVGSVIE